MFCSPFKNCLYIFFLEFLKIISSWPQGIRMPVTYFLCRFVDVRRKPRFLSCFALYRQLRIPLNLFISEAKNKQMDQLMEQRNALAAQNPAQNKLRTSRLADVWAKASVRLGSFAWSTLIAAKLITRSLAIFSWADVLCNCQRLFCRAAGNLMAISNFWLVVAPTKITGKIAVSTCTAAEHLAIFAGKKK